MRNLFADLYEVIFGIQDPMYHLLFTHAYYLSDGYVFFGLIFIFIALVMTVLFYFAFRYPYGKWWHWGIMLVVTVIFVFTSTYYLSYDLIFSNTNMELRNALNDQETGYRNFAYKVTLQISIVNAFLATLVFLLCSYIFKQFSKFQAHLPF